MHYLIDDYTDPWREAQTILLLHGNAESGAVWLRIPDQGDRVFRANVTGDSGGM